MEQNDTDLWKAFLQGHDEAVGELYRRYYPLLRSYGIRMTGDRELTVDTIQDLFVKLMLNRAKLHPTDHVKFYLLSAFRHKLLDAFQQMRPTIDVEECHEYFALDPDDIPDKDDQDVLRERRLVKALGRLTGRQREILYLYYVKDLSHKEIASLLDMNAQSSKNLLFRTLSYLRTLVGILIFLLFLPVR